MRTALLLLLCCLRSPPAAAQAPATERIDRLLRLLDHPSWTKREAAQRKLVALGPAALPRLRLAAGRRTLSLESRRRLRRVIERMAFAAVPTVGGLSGRLTADRRELRPGQRLTLRMTLANLTSRELFISKQDIGSEPIVKGSRLRLLCATTGTRIEWTNLSERGCPHGEPAKLTHLAAGQARLVRYVLRARAGRLPGHVRLAFEAPFSFGIGRYEAELPAGKYHIRSPGRRALLVACLQQRV